MNSNKNKFVRERDAFGRFKAKTLKPSKKVEFPTILVKDLNTRLNTNNDYFLQSLDSGKIYTLNYAYHHTYFPKNSQSILSLRNIETGEDEGFTLQDTYSFGFIKKNDPRYAECEAKVEKGKIKNIHKYLEYRGTIGSDPEIFVEGKNGMIPAFLFLPSKRRPVYSPNNFDRYGNHGGTSMYWDGFQAEFTTQAPTCLGHHTDSVSAGLQGIYDEARKKFPDAKLSMKSVFYIPQDILDNTDDEYVNFGCMPSFNAYGLKTNMPPARMTPIRSAGGHIHFGIGKTSHKMAEPMVKALDAILGVACVSLFAKFDDPNRRQLYGLPGEYRLPAHGLEYRPLSNAWLCHPMIMNLVLDLGRKALAFGKSGFLSHWKASEKETIQCIIDCDVEASHRILKDNEDLFKGLLKASYLSATNNDLNQLMNLFLNGIGSGVSNPADLARNWKMDGGWVRHQGAYGEPNVSTFLRERRNNPKYKM